ncbi:hypothetical protein GQ53DRAFT_819653 [Thozetella sp. PMI_491]|nr:hypothetical protein GQ53DRAFT_819653 [Thozetella sp. PMI_491]
MISDTGSRLAVAAALLSFQTIIFVGEIVLVVVRSVIKFTFEIKNPKVNINFSSIRGPRLLTLLHHLAAPISIGLLGAILVPIAFTSSSREYPAMNAARQCDTEVDADIGGDGIRVAIWVQESVLILLAILGTFHSSATGAKETGAGLAITHISLAIALLVQMGRGTLSSVDAMIGAMILDSQSSALSIQFVSKETLAARWQVCIMNPCQVFGLVAEAILVAGFERRAYGTEACSCISVFWWGWLSSCSAASSREMSIFWVYYALRVMAFAQCSFHSLKDTWKFHAAEKYNKSLSGISYPKLETGTVDSEKNQQDDNQRREVTPPDEAEAGVEVRQDESRNGDDNNDPHENTDSRGLAITHTPPVARQRWEMEEDELRYHDYPATITLVYIVHSVFALASMTAVETAMRELELHPSSQVFSVGQIIAIVVAGATIIRAIYLFWGLFFSQWNKFVWAFSLRVAKEVVVGTRRPTYRLLPPPNGQPPGGVPFPAATDDCPVRIGNIVSNHEGVYDPIRIEDGINNELAVSRIRGFSFTIPERVFRIAITIPGQTQSFQTSVAQEVGFLVDELETVSFVPSGRQLAELAKDESVALALKQGTVVRVAYRECRHRAVSEL